MLYEYCVIIDDEDDHVIVVPISSMVASSVEVVRTTAARVIPEGTDLEKVQILVRPFVR